MKKKLFYILAPIAFIFLGFTLNYPIDGYTRTGITRLLPIQDKLLKNEPYHRIKYGAYYSIEDIKLQLLSRSEDSAAVLLTEDKEFEKLLEPLFPSQGYSAAVLDMTNPEELRYADFRENVGYQPGSVGKIAVINALFDQLANVCPDSFEERIHILKNKRVGSGIWGTGDHHTIPVYDEKRKTIVKRQVVATDTFSLYEWADHMLSVSNNGAASVVYREALLMKAFGRDYENLTQEQANTFFKETSRDSLTNMSYDVVNEPLRDLGIDKNEWRLGGFFTNGPGQYISRKGGSIGTPVGLMKYMVNLEQGHVVDVPSSLEIKRLLYLTDRRIRYAASPALDSAAVYFKSGSFYKCNRSLGTYCNDYAGNEFNYMNSVITVEHPNGRKYMVCLMTNVLSKNSAGAHMYLAGKIDQTLAEASK